MTHRLRDRLLDLLDECRRHERDELVPLVARERHTGWTYKDHIAHLSAWRDYTRDVLRAARGLAAAPPPIDVARIDAKNAEIYAANRERDAASVLGDANASYERLADELRECTDGLLHSPRPDRPALETWNVLPGNLETHLAMHLSQLYLEDCDFDAAEREELWAYRLDLELIDDDRARAGTEYNLGCFYARAGRAGEAASRFRIAFAADPSLVAWAREDPDLGPVRDDASIAVLLA